MDKVLRLARWALVGLLGLLFVCGILMMARPEACVRADLLEACNSQWEPACAQLLGAGAEWSRPGWCTTYNYGVFFGVVFGAAGLVLIGAPVAVFLILDRVFILGARWISYFARRQA